MLVAGLGTACTLTPSWMLGREMKVLLRKASEIHNKINQCDLFPVKLLGPENMKSLCSQNIVLMAGSHIGNKNNRASIPISDGIKGESHLLNQPKIKVSYVQEEPIPLSADGGVPCSSSRHAASRDLLLLSKEETAYTREGVMAIVIHFKEIVW